MTDQSSPPSETVPATLRELPPSPTLVAKLLEYEGDLTQAQLVEETLLPRRTVRHALTELEERDLVTSRTSITDARQHVYSLATDGPEESSYAVASSATRS